MRGVHRTQLPRKKKGRGLALGVSRDVSRSSTGGGERDSQAEEFERKKLNLRQRTAERDADRLRSPWNVAEQSEKKTREERKRRRERERERSLQEACCSSPSLLPHAVRPDWSSCEERRLWGLLLLLLLCTQHEASAGGGGGSGRRLSRRRRRRNGGSRSSGRGGALATATTPTTTGASTPTFLPDVHFLVLSPAAPVTPSTRVVLLVVGSARSSGLAC